MRGQTLSLYDSSGIERKRKMKEKNASSGYFVLLGFSNWPHLELVLFVVILMFYASLGRKATAIKRKELLRGNF